MKILCINPGSTSTRLAVFEDDQKVFITNVAHSNEKLESLGHVQEQLEYRYEMICDILKENGIDVATMDCIVGRGGALRPMPGGIFYINDAMLADCISGKYSEHPSNLGCQIAKRFADKYGLPCFVVDPPLMDEFLPEARVSGFKPLQRISAFHALNERIVARFVAKELGKPIEECNIITTHLGSGVSLTPHINGKCCDNTFGSGGDGPFSPERCGRLPSVSMLEYMDKDVSKVQKKFFSKGSGVLSYLGYNDMITAEKAMRDGDELAHQVLDGMAYILAKEIAAFATIMNWKVDAIGITGAIANSKYMVKRIREQVEFLAPVYVYPGEFEMEGLANGGIRALNKEEEIKTY
ncbi:MAG: butyrate kinase [Mogibacterium sp.]|nr:butyrate kinase [Mogibacterium sp.]